MNNKSKKNVLVNVTPNPKFVPEQSDPAKEKFVWTYEITIENKSEEILQLLNRYWRIVDMTGHIEEIHGVGVIGLQPLIKPGKHFTYSSFCQLMTPQGTMTGHFEMQNLDDKRYVVEIPQFILSAPTDMTETFKSILH